MYTTKIFNELAPLMKEIEVWSVWKKGRAKTDLVSIHLNEEDAKIALATSTVGMTLRRISFAYALECMAYQEYMNGKWKQYKKDLSFVNKYWEKMNTMEENLKKEMIKTITKILK